MFDAVTGKALNDVVYRVSILKDELLTRGLFYDADGQLDVAIIWVSDCDEPEPEKCFVYRGKEYASWPGALYRPSGPCDDDDPHSCIRPTITGPVFAEGGLYKITVDILSAGDPRVQAGSDDPISYEAFVIHPERYSFQIDADYGKEDFVRVTSHYDVIKGLTVAQSDGSISFDMPFDWNHDHVEQIFTIYETVLVPNSLAQWNMTNPRLFINGIDLSPKVISSGFYEPDVPNQILIAMTQKDLKRINEILGEGHSFHDNMNFRLVPAEGAAKDVAYIRLAGQEAYHAQAPVVTRISWDGERAAGQTTRFEFAFLDERGMEVENVLYAYSVCAGRGGQAEATSFGRNDPDCPWTGSSKETYVHEIMIPNEGGRFRVDMEVFGFEHGQTHAGTGSALIKVSPQGSGTTEPELGIGTLAMIKFVAELWMEGAAHDAQFASRVTNNLVAFELVHISQAAYDDGLNPGPFPDWIKIFVGYWVDGTVDDATFLNTMQFLIEEGVL